MKAFLFCLAKLMTKGDVVYVKTPKILPSEDDPDATLIPADQAQDLLDQMTKKFNEELNKHVKASAKFEMISYISFFLAVLGMLGWLSTWIM